MTRSSITSSRDFRRVYRSGTKGRSDGITVWVAPRGDEEATRLGMAIRASVGTAVERNRLRRRLRAIFRARVQEVGADVVVAASTAATGKNCQDLERALCSALSVAGVRITAP